MAGRIETIHVAGEAGAPMRPLQSAQLDSTGLAGDRYGTGRGHFSGKPGAGRALTLIEAEAVESVGLSPGESRRNVTTRGVALDELVGRRFQLGSALCEGKRLCQPCAYLEGLTQKKILFSLAGRGGLRADVLRAGEIRVGDALTPLEARSIAPDDIPAIAALNNAHPAEIGLIEESKLRRLLDVAALATALGPPGDPDAFLIAFDERGPAQGPNHAWFLARRARFLYIDRVCVHPRARRRGLARALYEDAFACAQGRTVCCEVNSDPPNPVSDAFHAALGFREVGRAFLADRGKSVRYLER